MTNQKPSRGEIWFIDLNPVVGHEQAKIRPCLIISHDTFNHGPANLHVILPLTSKNKNLPLHLPLEWLEGGSETQSFVLCDQIRTVSRQRFKGKCLGIASKKTMEKIEYILGILLNI